MAFVHKALKNVTAILAGDVIGKVLAMVTSVVLARYLGPEDYGKHAFILSFTYTFMILADFGLNDLIIRDVARDRSLSAHYFATSAVIKTAFSMASILFMVCVLYLIGYPRETIIYTMCFSGVIVFITMTNSIMAIFKAHERMEYASLVTVMNSLILFLFIVSLTYLKGTLLEVILARVLAAGLVAVLGVLILARKIAPLAFSTSPAAVRKLSAASFPFMTIGIISALYFSLDVIMLSRFKGPVYVGWFTPAANDLFFGLMIIPGAVTAVTYPMFSRHYGESVDQLRRSCNFTIKVLTIIGVAISAGTFVLAPKIIHFIYGDKYENSIIVLRIISLAVSFLFAREPLGFALSVVGRVKTLMWMNVAFLALNALLNLFFIPRYAHVGAAVTTVICIFLSLFVGARYFLNKEIGNIVIAENFLKPVISAAIMCAALYGVQDLHLLLQVLIGACVYALAIMALRTFGPDDRIILRRLIVRVSPG